jgi:hypothetical protein
MLESRDTVSISNGQERTAQNRRRAFLNLIVSPVALLLTVGVVYVAWRVVLAWTSSEDPGTKLALSVLVAALFALELGLIYATLRFMWWALGDIIKGMRQRK